MAQQRAAEEIRQAAFNITAAFEGSGYDALQTFDEGIVSYGRFQFTLASGSLFSVLERYLNTADSVEADRLKPYLEPVRQRQAGLKDDDSFKSALKAAANDPAMKFAQNEIATEKYWTLVQDLSIRPRNIQTALGQALVFDMAINHGPRHDMIGLAEEALGVPPKSRMPENGASETQLISKLAAVRQDRMHRLADKYGWEGLRQRGDFWVALVKSGDWDLRGDADGMLEVKPGLRVKVG